ncbi:Flagellar hook-associated protein 1 [compost metagenome]
MSTQLSNLDRDLNSNIDVKGKEIQSYLSSIANLNQSIYKIEGMGDQANDLRDQRDLLTDKLSKLMNVTVLDTDAGYTISLGGQPLVQGAAVAATVDSAFLNNAYASGDLKAGEAYGMIFSSKTYVTDYQKQLDDMANTIANGEVQVTIPSGSTLPAGTKVLKDSTIINSDGSTTTLLAGSEVPVPLVGDLKTTVQGLNGLHQLGYAMDGSTGRAFFTPAIAGETITAANLRLNPQIAADPTLFATSLRATTDSDGKVTTIKGNNAMALLFSNMKDNNTFTSPDGTKTGTVGSYLSSMVGQLGIQSQEAARQADNSDYLVEQVNSRRQSVSGVSLDEEMSNMLVFQHAYSAAARFMTTYDEMLDKLINSTGTVGR